ncbi:hypothetical protein A5630_07915 [Mycolicibacterium mucogenicum]|uniref:Uncharacterized protein n=1 Tax=Mycolicibacterium mucogenicum TaxID=56689 RepID=A0A1A3GLF3_MYCMU|nr:hypothetical protein A5630_07915 [Mycolicibacterium mucogenicum]
MVWAELRRSRPIELSNPVVIAIIGANGFGAVFGVAARDTGVVVPIFAVALAGWAENTAATAAAAAGRGEVAAAGESAAAGDTAEAFAGEWVSAFDAALVFGVDDVGRLGVVDDALRGCRADAAGELAFAGEFLFAWVRLLGLGFDDPAWSVPESVLVPDSVLPAP